MPESETEIGRIKARRKGRSRKPCEIVVCCSDTNDVVLRTVDESGVPPIVAVIAAQDVLRLAGLLNDAANRTARPTDDDE